MDFPVGPSCQPEYWDARPSRTSSPCGRRPGGPGQLTLALTRTGARAGETSGLANEGAGNDMEAIKYRLVGSMSSTDLSQEN